MSGGKIQAIITKAIDMIDGKDESLFKAVLANLKAIVSKKNYNIGYVYSIGTGSILNINGALQFALAQLIAEELGVTHYVQETSLSKEEYDYVQGTTNVTMLNRTNMFPRPEAGDWLQGVVFMFNATYGMINELFETKHDDIIYIGTRPEYYASIVGNKVSKKLERMMRKGRFQRESFQHFANCDYPEFLNAFHESAIVYYEGP